MAALLLQPFRPYALLLLVSYPIDGIGAGLPRRCFLLGTSLDLVLCVLQDPLMQLVAQSLL